MNILINCSCLRIGGGLQVAHSFVTELKQYIENNYIIVCSEQIKEMFIPTEYGTNFVFTTYSKRPTLILRDNFLDKLVEQYKINCVFTVFGPSYWVPKVTHICGFARPHFIYKDSPFFDSLSFYSNLKLKIGNYLRLKVFKTADVLVTENKDVTSVLKTLIPKKPIFTVTNYYNQLFEDKRKWKEKSLPDFNGFTLLTISANYPHKNIQIIPKVVEVLKEKAPDFKFRFVITVDDDVFTDIDLSIKKHITCIGKVDISECPSLYEQADVMFLPTLLECFSASYPEAMYMKTPILTSNLGFAKGLCGDAAIYFDPMSANDIASKIMYLYNDKNLQKELINEGLKRLNSYDNFEQRTQKYLELIYNYA